MSGGNWNTLCADLMYIPKQWSKFQFFLAVVHMRSGYCWFEPLVERKAKNLIAPFKKVLKDGIKLSHFDSHEHIHHSPWVFKIITDLGKEFKINKIRFVNEKVIIKNYFKDVYYKLKSLNYLKHFIINICNKKIKNNFVSPDYFFGILNSGKTKIDEFFLYLDCLNSDTTVELCIHPANRLVDQMNIKNNINQRNFYKSENRIIEKNLLLSDQLRNFLIHKKINLINFSDIN